MIVVANTFEHGGGRVAQVVQRGGEVERRRGAQLAKVGALDHIGSGSGGDPRLFHDQAPSAGRQTLQGR